MSAVKGKSPLDAELVRRLRLLDKGERLREMRKERGLRFQSQLLEQLKSPGGPGRALLGSPAWKPAPSRLAEADRQTSCACLHWRARTPDSGVLTRSDVSASSTGLPLSA